MTAYARRVLNDDVPRGFLSEKELSEASICEILTNKFKCYYKLSIEEIAAKLKCDINISNKSEVARLTSMILGVKGTNVNDIEELKKANIKFKTIRLEPNGCPRESMSFEQIDFSRLITDSWEKSQFYERFEYTKFLFVVFQYNDKYEKNVYRPLYLKKVMLWNMPEKVIQNELKQLFEDTKRVITNGIELVECRHGIKNNLPGEKDNPVCHIRPKGKNGQDKVELPDPNRSSITKQAYWLNKKYISMIIGESGEC